MKKISKADLLIQRFETLPLIRQIAHQSEVNPKRVLTVYCPALLLFTVVISNLGSWAYTTDKGTLSGVCAFVLVFTLIIVSLSAFVVWRKLYR
ncbi:MAG: hypothetical protein HC851_20280 [Acaryochloris sp. RU_4_1]|nr:hypothetical protein [Acaryochloris sp. RU_4_1]